MGLTAGNIDRGDGVRLDPTNRLVSELSDKIRNVRAQYSGNASAPGADLALRDARGMELAMSAIQNGPDAVKESFDLAATALKKIIEEKRKELREARGIEDRERELRLESIHSMTVTEKMLAYKADVASKGNRRPASVTDNRASKVMRSDPLDVVASRE